MDLTQLFYDLDNFVNNLFKNSSQQITFEKNKSTRGPKPQMHLSELMTVLILYHASGYKNFKSFYFALLKDYKKDFPHLLSYSRFVEWTPYCLIPLTMFIKSKLVTNSEIYFIDSTSLAVCRNIRINRNLVFKDIATRGKTSMGWFFGFKLHIVVNERGELVNFAITKGNIHDIVPVKKLCQKIKGKVYGDKGYCSKKIFEELFTNGLQLITNIRGNMKNKLIPIEDKIMLRKRFIIETINDQLKNISNIEHTRHRSPTNFIVNIIAGLISYIYKPAKPAISQF